MINRHILRISDLAPAAQRKALAVLNARENDVGPSQKKNATKGNKFRAVPTIIDGMRFASKAEAKRYAELSQMQRAGLIKNLVCHKRFPLSVRGIKICTYVSDFTYDRDGVPVVEDVKSNPTRTPQYRMKKKLMLAVYGISLEEVMT